jgi:hypothetical protein
MFSGGCGNATTAPPVDSSDLGGTETPDVWGESREPEAVVFPDAMPDEMPGDLAPWDVPTQETIDLEPQCEPGQGCFLQPCSTNDECESGWCVEHMGQKVCTQACQEECPAGWTCSQVGATEPDVVFICVSNYTSLCRPCTAAADCVGTTGTKDACVSYGIQGAFCGGTCGQDDQCPTGFACQNVTTVDGIELEQCVAKTGLCPCTDTAVELGLFTHCEVINEVGTCKGKRICTADGLTPCDAPDPSEELCNGLDDDCDGDVDEGDIVEGLGVCDDGNECTADKCLGADGCEHQLLSAGECKDNDACTVADHCEEGTCVGNPVLCDDGNPCTDDACDGSGGCVFVDNEDDCDDGDPCTVADQCVAGNCTGEAVSCECQNDKDCLLLEDGDLCNGTLFCDTAEWPYKCKVAPESVVTCAAPPAGPDAFCKQAFCDPASGKCSLIADHEGFSCDDGNACNVGDKCGAGKCLPGVPAICTDDNSCTDDSCSPDSGCVFTPNTLPCDDGSLCTVGDQCAQAACQPGSALVCSDGNGCTDDGCLPAQGCVYVPNQAPCDDGVECTLGDQCAEGKCVWADLASCDDGNPCTDNVCDPLLGCVSTAKEGLCDDGNACTVGDHCEMGACVYDDEFFCGDNNECTDDACDPLLGCVYKLNQAPCSDGNACTEGEQCSTGVCGGGKPLSCDDGSACTTDSCDPGLGCQYKNMCVGWHTVVLVPTAFTQQAAGSGTMSLTFGQPVSGIQECDASTVHFGFGPVSIAN